MTASLVPATVEARAESRRWLPFGFGPRFFIALLLGLVWLVPAWWSPRLIAAMFLWDALLVIAWLIDLFRLPPPEALEVRRVWHAPLSLARPAAVTIEIRNKGREGIRAALVDETPGAAGDEPPSLHAAIPPGDVETLQYTIVPRERGDAHFGATFIRYRSSLAFAERWAVAGLSQIVRVLPDLVQAREDALYLIRSRQTEMEKRRRRQRGFGREFESLREYRQGDDLRDMCWPATARRNQLVVRTYEAERSQTVWMVIDAGRLLRARVRNPAQAFELSKLDYAVNAALSLATIASQAGDRVGLLAYGRSIQQSVAPARGSRHVRTLVESLAQVHSEPAEANHGRVARALLRMQSRRCLVVWITDFAETAMTPEVIEYAMQMTRRNLVVFAAVTQPDLIQVARTIPASEEEMYRHTAALEIIQRRELLLRDLRQRGVLAMELTPGQLSASLINEYLEIKDRSLL